MRIKLIKTKAKSIFTKTKLPGAKWVINQYVGCEHACLYCYAKFICRWKNYGKWGSFVEAKINAPELVKGKYVNGWVFMSSISDPYQPVEKKLKLTRKILENLDKRINLSILTKSDLVLRDIDLFKRFEEIAVGLTINNFDSDLKNIFEPFSSSNKRRINVLKILKDRQMETYAFVSPIIPGLINLRKTIRETKNFTDSYWFEMLNLKGAGSEFASILKEKFPQSFETLKAKNKFFDFVQECKRIIRLEKIKVQGIVIH